MNLRARLAYALLWAIGRLPLRAAYMLGDGLGLLAYRFGWRETRITRRNMELAFPTLPQAEREALIREALRHTGRTMAETCRFWTRPASHNLRLVQAVVGGELLDAARSAGRGVIIAAPHLGNWELLNQFLSTRAPIAIVYRPPRQAWLEDLLRHVRNHERITQVRAEAAGVRQLLRALKIGGTVGILPDQQPKRGDGEFAPFFGQPAFTMTLLPRLAHRTGAQVLLAWAERLPHNAGFRIQIRPAAPGLHGGDSQQAVAALNAGIETCVREIPAQYQWSYKRYSIRPPDTPKRYY